MNTKTLVSLAMLIGIGSVLHLVIPGFVLGMKPDMMLAMIFLGIILFPNRKNVLLLGAVAGVISGLTTTFPGGLVPNIIDKLITAFVFYGLFLIVSKQTKSIVSIAVLTAIGTIVSGAVFLTSAYFIVGLPDSFALLFGSTVLPAALINAVTMVIIYPIVNSIIRRTSIAENI